MELLKPNEQRAKNSILFIYISMVMSILFFIADWCQYVLLVDVENGVTVSTKRAEINDLIQNVLGITHIVVYILCIIFFIMWFRRAYFNLHQKASWLQYSEGWAAGAWFVPILSLFRPYQIMKELYSETDFLLSKYNSIIKLKSDMLGWWWTLWIVSLIINQIGNRLSLRASEIPELKTATMVDAISSIVSIPLCLLAIKVIKDYARVEPLLPTLNDNATENDSIFSEAEHRHYSEENS